jgi:hypothetical protein
MEYNEIVSVSLLVSMTPNQAACNETGVRSQFLMGESYCPELLPIARRQ